MAKTVTLATLRTQCRDRFEISSDQVTDSTLNAWINAGYFKLYNHLLRHAPDWYVSSDTQSLTSGTRSYNLPSGCFRVRRVDLLDGANQVSLQTYAFAEENVLQRASVATRSSYRYCVSGSTIRIAPLPTENITNGLTVWHNPAPATLSADGDTIDGVSGWEEFIILDVGIRTYHKLDWDSVPLVMERKDIIDLIKSLASTKDAANPKRIRDTVGETGLGGGDPWY